MIGPRLLYALVVASRPEGQSKTYDVGTIVGESTTARAADFPFLELDLLKVPFPPDWDGTAEAIGK